MLFLFLWCFSSCSSSSLIFSLMLMGDLEVFLLWKRSLFLIPFL